jgi:hypothetical protein
VRRKRMPQIVITADGKDPRRGREVLRERVAVSDLESEMFTAHLVERIEWALSDAQSLETAPGAPSGVSGAERRPRAVPAG